MSRRGRAFRDWFFGVDDPDIYQFEKKDAARREFLCGLSDLLYACLDLLREIL